MKIPTRGSVGPRRRCGATVLGAATLGLLPAALPVPPLAAQARGSSAFVDVHVVRPEYGDVLAGQTVLVRDGVILEVGALDQVTLPRGTNRIEGRGAYLVPGLIELSGTIPRPDPAYRVEDLLLALLARGVTTLRGAQTHPSQTDLQRRVERGNTAGPRLLLVSEEALPAPAGEPPPGEGAAVSAPEALRSLTTAAAAALGLGHEIGRIEPGLRADLLLVAANPLEHGTNLRRVVGVMAHGRWNPASTTERRLTERAQELVLGYYRTLPPRGISVPGCTGVTLQDCFGGDLECGSRPSCRSEHVRELRSRLLDQLDLLGRLAPTSDWVVGQRVSFALEHDDAGRAAEAAEACGAALWWCQALRGYVRHARVPGSGGPQLDSAFANAAGGTPAWAEPRLPFAGDRGLHCEWTDLSTLVRGTLRAQLERLGCGLETPLHARFWWLADPLWSVPGNERRDEHFVRNIQMRLHDEILRLSRNWHPQEHHQSVMPMGLPNSWRPVTALRRSGPSGRAASAAVVESSAAYVNGGYGFAPDERRFYDPTRTTAADWALAWDSGDDRMILPERWYELEHQLAVLRRDGRLLVLAAARPPLLLPSWEGVAAALAMGRPIDQHVEIQPMQVEATGALRASLQLDPPAPDPERMSFLWSERDFDWMASLEVVGEGFRGRARGGAAAPPLADGFGVSDLVLVDERFEQERLPLLEAMLTSPDLAGRSSVGVYFEVYGVRQDEPLQVVVSGERTNLSLLERMGGALRLRAGTALEVAWLEPAETPTPGTMPRHLTVDLGGLAPGQYQLTVSVRRGDGREAGSARVVRVDPPR